MQTTTIQNTSDNKLCGLITYYFVMTGVLLLFTAIPVLSSYTRIVSYTYWGSFYFWVVKLIPNIMKRGKKMVSASYFIFGGLYLISVLLSLIRDKPVDIMLGHDALWTFVYYLPLGLVAFSVTNFTMLYEMLYKYSFIITLCCAAVFINHILNPLMSYDMTFGYTLLVPTLLHFSWFFSRKAGLWLLLISILEVLMLLLYGSRGVFIAIVVYFVLRLFFLNKRKIHMSVIVPIIGVVVLFFAYSGPKLLADYLESQGIYSRTLMAFMDPDYEQTGDRNEHWVAGIDLIKRNPIVGYGIGGYYYDFHDQLMKNAPEKQYVFDPIERVYNKATPTYGGCHSGSLEILIFFGLLIGFPLVCWILFSIFKIDRKAERNFIELFVIFYSIYIIPNVIVSSGFHYKPGCAIYFFMFLHYLQSKKQRVLNQNIKDLFPVTSYSDAVNS